MLILEHRKNGAFMSVAFKEHLSKERRLKSTLKTDWMGKNVKGLS